jgi:hypothetical protein
MADKGLVMQCDVSDWRRQQKEQRWIIRQQCPDHQTVRSVTLLSARLGSSLSILPCLSSACAFAYRSFAFLF